jgi:hypothetical protein
VIRIEEMIIEERKGEERRAGPHITHEEEGLSNELQFEILP